MYLEIIIINKGEIKSKLFPVNVCAEKKKQRFISKCERRVLKII